jgi:GT2 family glycosyltransferase
MENSIIIPTYKNAQGLKDCVASIIKTTDLSRTDVWIVCNGSPSEAVDWASKLGNSFHVLSCPEPLGYTRAVNVGMMAAQSDNVILLNDDAAILDWGGNDVWIRMLTDPFKDKTVAVTGSTIDWWAKDKPFIVFFCVAIRRSVVKEIGFLDEAFNPGAGEDTDFCIKAQRLGYKILQVPEQLPHWGTHFPIWHIGNITCGNIPGWKDVTTRNKALLEERYPRTEEDRQLQLDFSTGRQNFHMWFGPVPK